MAEKLTFDRDHSKVRFWPGPEILAINLIAENQPFDTTWHEKFRCNRHGRLMAGWGEVASGRFGAF